jgi:phenylacetate-CoA ligase
MKQKSNTKNIRWIINTFIFNPYRTQAKKIIQKSDQWTKSQINDYQYNQLKKLITFAFNTVPYYAESFKKAGFHPGNFKTLEDIKNVPVLTKNDVRNNLDSLVSTEFPRKYLMEDTSGGTTGLPTTFYADIRTYSPVEWVYINSLWKRMDYKFYDKYVVFRGEVINPQRDNDQVNYWKYDRLRNCIIFSSFMMNDEIIPVYIKKINEFKPRFIHSYPSTLFVLANYLIKNNLEGFPFIKGIFLGSETLYPWQREMFQKVFRARLFRWYGHRERCILGGEQDLPEVYELFPTYGYTELLNNKGEWSSQHGEEGEIIGTGFYNYAFPLIRYNTHDIAENCLEKTSYREFMRIRNIKGRIQDFFVDKNGSLITFSTSYKAIIHIKDKISAHQFVQDQPGKLVLKIEPKVELAEQELELVRNGFKERFPLFDLEIRIEKQIPRTISGKFRYFVQNLDIEFNKYK